MSEPLELHSPFQLLDEIDEAKEVLILSYTADLAFFERFALSHARALGAVVTLISDARMVGDDPMVVRQAGTAYMPGRAICPGTAAFHPKLMVLAGEKEARVAVGSGNLTLAGWHGNAEIWTVLRGGVEGAPGTIAAVAGFLRDLCDSPIRLGPGCAEALGRVADRLAAIAVTDAGPSLLHNLEQPIFDQLPRGPVEELTVSAPFYDERLAALEMLCDRLRPARLSVCVEPGTSVNGLRLERFLADRDGELNWIDSERYHHGKLVEWRLGDRVTVLSGSPNISGKALLTAVADGGNCELALLEDDADPCLPAIGQGPPGGVTELDRDADPPSAALLPVPLGAVAEDSRVWLTLDRQLTAPARVQRYDLGNDGWTTIGEFPARTESHWLPREVAPLASALRLLLADGATTDRVFVTDLARVCRPAPTASGRARVSIAEVVASGLEKVLLEDLEDLRPQLIRAGAIVPGIAGEDGGGAEPDAGDERRARAAPSQTIDDLIAAAEPILGRDLTEFALALPALRGIGIDGEEWVATEDPDPTGEAPGEALDGEGDEPPTLAEVLAAASTLERTRFKRFVERLIERAPGYPMLVRTLALRTLLHGIRHEVWGEEEWPAWIEKALRALTTPGDEPGEAERAAAASLAALALAMLRGEVARLSVRDESALRYERAFAAAAPLLEPLDPEQVELLAPEMPPPLDDVAVEAAEMIVAEALASSVGAERAVRLLAEEYGIEARIRDDNIIEFSESLPPFAEPQLFLTLGLVRDEGPIAVRGRIDDRTEVLAVWKAPHLVVERSNTKRWGRLFRLPSALSPLNYANLDADLPRPLASWMAGESPPELALGLLGLAEPQSRPSQ